jgi:hypothetical protein
LKRALAGDPAVLPQLKQAFDNHPELTGLFGDLVEHAEQALVQLAAGGNLVAEEALHRRLAELRAELLDSGSSALERLLIDRIIIGWLEVYHGDIDLAQQLVQQPANLAAALAAQRRLDRAQRRFLAAIRALVTTQKLLRPALSPVQIATRLQRPASSGEQFRHSPLRETIGMDG